MFTTMMAAVTMTGLLTTGAYLPGPTWVSDYSVALRQAAEQGKPIAVFIAKGGDGYAHVVKEGPMPTDATRILNDKFVCLFVDTTTEAGQATAGVFEMKEGLVLSTRGGKQQALRVEGSVAQSNLNQYLAKYSEAGATVATTETNAPAAVVPAAYSQPAYGQPVASPFNMGGYCPSCQRR